MTVLGFSLRTVRAVLTSVIVLALLAGIGLSVRRTTTTTTVSRPAANSVPAPAASSPSVSALPPADVQPLPVSATARAVTPTTTPAASGPTTPTPPASTPATGIPAVQIASIGKCPIKLSTPKNMGGVQSLVAFAPAFGPFSAEAFAAAAAYQPELELLGPILAQYPQFAPVVAPLLKPVLSLFATGSNSLFAVIEPLYKPYRTQVLSAETKLAAAIAPFSAKLSGTPLAGCVVDLEAALVGDTSKTKKK